MSAWHAEAEDGGWLVDLYTERFWGFHHVPPPAVTVWAGDAHDGEPLVFDSPARLRELAGAILAAAGELERVQRG